jgi:hypothetical protein
MQKLENARSLDDVTLALNRLGNCKTVSKKVLEETGIIEDVERHEKRLGKRQEIILVNLCKQMVTGWKEIMMQKDSQDGEEEDDDIPEWRTKLDKIKERKHDNSERGSGIDWYDRDLSLETSSMISDEKLLDRTHMLPPIGGRRSSEDFDPFFAQMVHEIEHDYLKNCWYQKENKYLAIAKAKDSAKLELPSSGDLEAKAAVDNEKNNVAKERAKRKAAREEERKRKEAEAARLAEEARIQAEKDKRIHDQLMERKATDKLFYLGMVNGIQEGQMEALNEYRRKFKPRPLTSNMRRNKDEDEYSENEDAEGADEPADCGAGTADQKQGTADQKPGIEKIKRKIPYFKDVCQYDKAKAGSCKFGQGCKFLHPSRWVLGTDIAAEVADFAVGDPVICEAAGLPPPGSDDEEDSEED